MRTRKLYSVSRGVVLVRPPPDPRGTRFRVQGRFDSGGSPAGGPPRLEAPGVNPGPAGEGDVRIWPADEHGRCDSYILLKPPAGTALLKAWTQEIKIFLQETEVVVPRESEPGWIDLDAVLAHFLAEGRRRPSCHSPRGRVARGPSSPNPVSVPTLRLAD
ncbi:SsgA family sporulation/cell division regulator [Streptomyces sp. NBC_01446]|uniref:SsgA family sporulation/cell division regulator n=2 Tax=unclassified Streptomyces TaxID=2593676 RepID=A0AAU1UPE9_9ACTN|nr:SsgA family sporulation/cell division regulator [Streptomyces sp. NBC_01446]